MNLEILIKVKGSPVKAPGPTEWGAMHGGGTNGITGLAGQVSEED